MAACNKTPEPSSSRPFLQHITQSLEGRFEGSSPAHFPPFPHNDVIGIM